MPDDQDGHTSDLASRGSRRREIGTGFRRSLGLTALGTALPGAGLTQTRSRRLGWALLLVFLLSLGGAAYVVLSRGLTKTGLLIASRPSYLLWLTVVLALGGVIWCASIVATAVQSRPRRLDRGRTRALAVFTTVMVALIGGVSFKGAEYALIGRDTVTAIFTNTPTKPGQGAQVVEGDDPWADTPRVNILLLGSDAGVDRIGTRTDSMVVASIDTKTGRTVLISLPRNLEDAPLPKDSELRKVFPSGVYGEPSCPRLQADPSHTDYCLLNAIWTEADSLKASDPTTYRGEESAGRVEIRKVIGAIVGLKIDHTVIVDLAGFSQLIDAMGGIEVNIKLGGVNHDQPLPYGRPLGNGRYSAYFDKPGVQKLNGYKALWYARTRAADSDDQRQERQRCVIKAIVSQVNPVSMVSKYADIAKIARDNIWTDIPGQNLPAFVDLIERVQKAKIGSVPLTPAAGVRPGNPDYALIRTLVKKAIAAPTPTSTATPSQTPGSGATTPTRTAKPTTTTPVDECA